MYALLYLLPRKWLSRCTGWVVNRSLPPPLRLWSLRWFARHYRINLAEARQPLTAYRCIGDLFTRELQPGVRGVDDSATAVSPVDGCLTQCAHIVDGTLIQAKGHDYALTDLVCSSTLSDRLQGGMYWTFYLCPTDYHRVHSPISGTIDGVCHVPGTLWPVNAWSVARIDRLFTINERLIIPIQAPSGLCVVVMVGATNVGKMSLAFDPHLLSNQRAVRAQRERSYNPAIRIRKGDELGIFHMGSTVIVLHERRRQPAAAQAPHNVQWGTKLF